MSLKPLSSFLKGHGGVISKIEDGKLSLKLMEMGCIPGEEVRISSVSPFGDPIAIKVADYILSLRLADAEKILVMPEPVLHQDSSLK